MATTLEEMLNQQEAFGEPKAVSWESQVGNIFLDTFKTYTAVKTSQWAANGDATQSATGKDGERSGAAGLTEKAAANYMPLLIGGGLLLLVFIVLRK